MSNHILGPKTRALVVGLSWMLVLAACGVDRPAKKVLIIGLDGIRIDILAEADTPNIDRLIAVS